VSFSSPIALYALCDQAMLDQQGLSLESYITFCRDQHAEIIQYRNKMADLKTIKKQLQRLRMLWDKKLIVNDALELYVLCDGIHVGQEDLYAIDDDPKKAVSKIRQMIGDDKWIGLSTHNKEEVVAANALDLDYIGLGAYRSSGTKMDAKVLGEKLDSVAAFSTHKVAAIGGVKLSDKFQHVTYHVIGSGLIPVQRCSL